MVRPTTRDFRLVWGRGLSCFALTFGIANGAATTALALQEEPAQPAETQAAAELQAETLLDVLRRAFQSNPTIQAERARQRATKQLKPQAWSGALPQITASGAYTDVDQDQVINATTFDPNLPVDTPNETRNFQLETLSAQVQGELAIFTGLRNFNAIKQADARVRAGGAQLVSVEQSVLTNAATAYFDVVRDKEVVDANENNVRVLLRQKEEADLRFEVGEITRTDVAQAEARLAGARARLTSAKAQLAISRARFRELTGDNPGTLQEDPSLPVSPETIMSAVDIAKVYSPDVIAARANEEASRREIAIAKSAFSPQVSLTANYQYAEEPSSFVLEDEQFAYGVRATMPIFQGGLNISRVREARALNDADERRIVEAERRATAAVTASWEQLQAAQSNIVSAQSQLEANELALRGVRREAQLGARTTLDVLNAEQEFVNSVVDLASAERDARVALFELLANAGVLTLESLETAGGA